jgi:hypothetical protein
MADTSKRASFASRNHVELSGQAWFADLRKPHRIDAVATWCPTCFESILIRASSIRTSKRLLAGSATPGAR